MTLTSELTHALLWSAQNSGLVGLAVSTQFGDIFEHIPLSMDINTSTPTLTCFAFASPVQSLPGTTAFGVKTRDGVYGKIKGHGTRAGLKWRLHRGERGNAIEGPSAAISYILLKNIGFSGAVFDGLRLGWLDQDFFEQKIYVIPTREIRSGRQPKKEPV